MSMGDHAEGTISDTGLQGSFCIQSAIYDVTLTTDTLSWQQTDKKGKEAITVPLSEVLSVAAILSKPGVCISEAITVPLSEVLSVATLSSKPGGPVDKWCINYVKKLKGAKLRLSAITFTGKEEDCVEWTKYVQEHIEKINKHPRKVLVIINPISGGGSGLSTYKTKVSPILQTANVQTDVLVTERARHAQELMSSYDLESIDGIIVVGGDGVYHEVVNGLIRRSMTDANIDYNTADNDVPVIGTRLGLIPCGTGNGVASFCYGNMDIETAALSIFIGSSRSFGLFGVYCERELVAYSVILIGFGWWGDGLHACQSKRSQGKLRYSLALLQHMLFGATRTMELSLKYLPLKSPDKTDKPMSEEKVMSHDPKPPIDKQGSEVKVEGIELLKVVTTDNVTEQEQKAKDSEDKDEKDEKETEQNAASNKSEGEALTSEEKSVGWKLKEGRYAASVVFPLDMFARINDRRQTSCDCPTIVLNKVDSQGKAKMLRFIFRLLTKKKDMQLDETLDIVHPREFYCKLSNASEPGTESYQRECAMHIDGEAHYLKSPEYHVKFLGRKLQMFINDHGDGLSTE